MTQTRVVRTVCSPNCSGACGINAYVKNDRIEKIEPAEFPDERFRRICLKGISMAMQRIHHPERLRYPLRRVGERGEGKWQRISWDEAFDFIAGELGRIRDTHGSRANAWTTMTGNYGITATTSPERMANVLEGTWFSYLGLMGDAGCSMGYLPTLGVFNTSNEWADLVGSKLVLIFARNLADTGHSEMHFLFGAMEAGARVVVIDPRFSRTASKADQWVSPRPGTDAAMLLGMIHVILERDLLDHEFVATRSNAPFLVRSDNQQLLREDDLYGNGSQQTMVWDERASCAVPSGSVKHVALYAEQEMTLADGARVLCRTGLSVMREAWQAFSPAQAAAICEIPEQVIVQLALDYAQQTPAAIWLGQGAQRYFNGHLAFRAAITLGALCGNIGKRHAGVNWSDGAMFRLLFSLPEEWRFPGGKRASEVRGTRMMEAITQGDPWPIKSLWLAGYGFGTQSPNFDRFVKDVLPQLDLFVITEQMMTPAADYADIVLPCVSYYEDEMDLVPSAENHYVQLRQRAIEPVGESLNDWQIFAGVAQRMGCGEHWSMPAEERCRYLIGNSSDPAVANIDTQALFEQGVARLDLPDPHVPFADGVFPTPSGRIELYTEQLAEHGQAVATYTEPFESSRKPVAQRYPLTLLTSHPMHTVHSQHTNLPWIRELVSEPRLEINPSDARARGIAEGDLVEVFNERGTVQVKALLSSSARPGSINLPQGWWPRDFPAGHYNDLVHVTNNPAQDAIIESNFAIFDNQVELRKCPVIASN